MGQQKPKNNKEVIDPIEQKALKDAMNRFYQNRNNGDVEQTINKNTSSPLGTPLAPVQEYSQQPATNHTAQQYQPLANQPHPQTTVPTPEPVKMSGFQSTNDFQKYTPPPQNLNIDPNIKVEFEVIPFPSRGMYYPSRISEVVVEKLNAIDEDVLATTSLIENGTVLDVLIKRKVRAEGLNTDDLLVGDRNAILLFLRATGYGSEYLVRVADPRTGLPFEALVDLTQLKAKEISVLPDELGEFTCELKIRKALVKFRILNYREIQHVLQTAEARQAAYGTEYSEFGSLKLKAEVTEVNGNRNKDYVVQFIDALPAGDSLKLKQRINDVTPDVDMNYEFKTADGYAFKAKITVGVDFFFPFI